MPSRVTGPHQTVSESWRDFVCVCKHVNMFNCETEKRRGGKLESVLWLHAAVEKAAILNVQKNEAD